MRRGAGFRVGPFLIALALFLTWMMVSLVYALDTENGLIRAFTFAQLALAALMFSSVVDTTTKVRRVFWAFVLWTWASTVFALAQYYLGITSVAAGTLGNDLHAIARGKNDRFLHLLPPSQCGQSVTDSITGERQPFPDFYGCCFVAESDECELHH